MFRKSFIHRISLKILSKIQGSAYSFTSKFHRGQLQDLVALLSGRDFETRHYKEEIAEQAFNMLREGVLNFMNETNFKRFVMIIRSAGFIDSSMIRYIKKTVRNTSC